MGKNNTQIPYWILVNDKRNCVWHRFYFSRDDVLKDYTELTKEHGKSGWHVEKHTYWGSKTEKEFREL